MASYAPEGEAVSDEGEILGERVDPVSGAAGNVTFQATFVGDLSRQGVMFGPYLDYEDQGRFLVRNQTRQYSTSPWSSMYFEFSASFDIISVSTKQKDQFFVLGMDSGIGGEPPGYVIEKWTGIPICAYPSGEQTGMLMRRRQLFRGRSLGVIRAIAVDPEERFLLVLHEQEGLVSTSKLVVSTGATEVVFTSAELPSMQDADSIDRRRHVSEGMLWILQDVAMRNVTILYDYDEDGTIDTGMTFDYGAWMSLYGQGGDDVWTDDFVFH
jgi:hypothetical protein